MLNRTYFRLTAVAFVVSVAMACAKDSSTATGPLDDSSVIAASHGGGGASGGPLRVSCERRSNRSKISVDGNNLARGSYRARVTSGGNSVTSAAKKTVGDEVEFDFDSNRNDIAAGATAIPASFIVAVNGPDVTGDLLNAGGQVVQTLSVACRIR